MFERLFRYFSRKIEKDSGVKEGSKFNILHLGENTYIHPDSHIDFHTHIGANTNINGPAYIRSGKRCPVTIGKYCAIAHNFRVRPRNHNTNYLNLQDEFQDGHGFPSLEAIKGPVTIGNNVWIGDNVLVLSGVTIGDGSIIGAGSVVTKDIPAYHIAAGIPTRIIKKRFRDEIIQQLINIDWWDWSEEKIKRNSRIFSTKLNELEEIDLQLIIVD